DEVDERFHLEKSTKAASQFLKDSYRKYGSWALAAASYNMGRGNIAKQIERQKSSDYYNMVLGDETGRYLYRLIALKLILEDPEKYGYYLARDQYYTEIPSTLVEVDSAITSMPDFAHYYGINYKMLKELNPWLRDDKLTNPYRKKYQIKIIDTKYRKVSADTAFYKPRE
ncbi:MAG TPA: murein transglycosylase, partial [Marinilabiliales bacterium]|nr:murein transglycosylase [Marinilabiliales bacterium]